MLTRRLVYFTVSACVLSGAILACTPQNTPEPRSTTVATSLEETGVPEQVPEEPTPTPTSMVDIQPVPGTPLSREAVSARGPWMVFLSGNALWAAGADGLGASQLVRGYAVITSPAVSPSGRYIAYVTARTANYGRLELHLLELPSGRTKTITSLTSATTAVNPNAETTMGTAAGEIARAIVDGPSLAWSPDGTRLAFIGAMNGPSADLYVYSLADGSIKRLTSGPSQGYRPTWSPDGEVIVHAGADSFGSGAGYAMVGVWAAWADGSQVKELYVPDSGDEVFAGWVSETAFLVYSWDAGCGPHNLRSIDVEGEETNQIWPGAFFIQGPAPSIAYDPATGATLISLDEFTADAMCTADGRPQKPGLYLTNVRRPRPSYISEVSAFSPVWNSKLNLFVASTENGAIRVTTNGGLSALPAPSSATPVIAPDGTVWAWANSGFGDKPAGLWIGPVGQKAPTRVVDDAVHYATWSPDSQRVFFFTDDGLLVTTRSGSRPTLLTTARGWSGDVQWVKP